MSNVANGVERIEQPDQHSEEIPATARKPLLGKTRVIAGATAIGGMLVGSLVGMAVQVGVQSTGLLGPSVEDIIAEQASNFDQINARLDSLQDLSSDPEAARQMADLASLIGRQNELNQQASAELRHLESQVAEMKEQLLAEAGYAGGADFWLKGGESVTVGGAGQVFAVIGARGNVVDVNLNGARKRLTVGDSLEAVGGDRPCTLFYKLATPRQDGRVGFDLDCS